MNARTKCIEVERCEITWSFGTCSQVCNALPFETDGLPIGVYCKTGVVLRNPCGLPSCSSSCFIRALMLVAKCRLSPELCRGRTGAQGYDWKSWGRNSGKRSDLCRMAIRVFNTSSKLWSLRVIRSVPRFGPRILLLIGVALARLTTRGQQLYSLLCFFTRPPSRPPSSPPCRLLAIWMWFLDASFFAFFLQFSVVHDCQGDIHVENGSSADCIGDEGSLISHCFRNAVYNFLN
jgi:hypothetical protein